jgi:hypothetical protein
VQAMEDSGRADISGYLEQSRLTCREYNNSAIILAASVLARRKVAVKQMKVVVLLMLLMQRDERSHKNGGAWRGCWMNRPSMLGRDC